MQRAAAVEPPVECYEVRHPAVPLELDGRTILHLTDFHIRRGKAWPAVVGRLAGWCERNEVDVVALTGDYANHPPDDEAGIEMLGRLAKSLRARLGVYGIFGNHDSARFAGLARGIPEIRWLEGEVVEAAPGLEVVGVSFPEDLVGVIGTRPRAEGTVRVALAHYPTEVYTAAALGVDVVLAGHTHGGQVRWSPTLTPHTSSDLPSGYASGMYRLKRTVLCVSRGMGEAVAPIRVRCPAQAGLYVLRRGEFAGSGERLEAVVRW